MQLVAFWIALVGSVVLAQGPPPVNLDGVGPKVGDIVPDFELRDQMGRLRKLSSLAGSKGTMLVFYRSANW